jgi:hypothetical protein
MRAKETERGAAKDSRHTGQQRRSEKMHENLMNQKRWRPAGVRQMRAVHASDSDSSASDSSL